MTGKTALCLVGYGMIGHVHAEEYGNHRDDIDLYICDTDRGRREKAQEAHDPAGVFTDFDEVLKRVHIDAVDISLPHHLHHEAVLAALKAGKHVFLEKPIANSLSEADDMIRKAEERGLVLSVLENFRYEPGVDRARELMGAGVIGEPFMVNIHELSFAIEMTSRMKTYQWRMKEATGGGGILFDRGVHLMAMANRLGGPVRSVYAVTRRPDNKWEVDETSVITLVHENGIVTNIIESWNVRNPPRVPLMAVYGNRGSIVEVPEKRLPGHRQFEIGEIAVYSETDGRFHSTVSGDVIQGVQAYMKTLGEDEIPAESVEKTFSKGTSIDITTEFDGYNVYNEAIKDFLECVKTGKKPRVSGADARSDIELVFAAYESARRGEPVQLPLR